MTDKNANPEPFLQLLPKEQLMPVVVNSPHSGSFYPPSFVNSSRLGNLAIRKSEDFGVDELVRSAPLHGIPMLSATYPRAYVDVNREPYELDQVMFDGELPGFANKRSIRVSGGLGTIPRIVAEGEEIYAGKIPVEDALQRISSIYKPYHNALQNLIARTHVDFGQAVLIDFHSMPSSGALPEHGRRPDIVLGDRYSTSCAPSVVLHAKAVFSDLGYDVSINKPYAGGFITEHYGRPQSGLHALQVELNRELYMDEIRITKNRNFINLADDLSRFFSRFCELDFDTLAGQQSLAAE